MKKCLLLYGNNNINNLFDSHPSKNNLHGLWIALKKKLNNTHLLGVKRYNSEVQKFERFFEKNDRKWPKFFQAVRDLANLSKKDRERILESLK